MFFHGPRLEFGRARAAVNFRLIRPRACDCMARDKKRIQANSSPRHSPHSGRPSASRGVGSIEEARAWIAERGIEEIECMIPDQAGVARGKIMPAEKFFASPGMNMPTSIFLQTISGDYPE